MCYNTVIESQHTREKEMKLRIDQQQDQGKVLFFVVSGKGKTYKSYGVATNATAAKTILATINREMSAKNVIL